MKIINITSPFPYPPLQSWSGATPPEGWAEFPERFTPVFYPADKRFAGFVSLTVEGGVVTACAWDEEAYQAYCEAQGAADLTAVKSAKLAELSAACNDAIVAGCGVTLSNGVTGRIRLTDEDQINLTAAVGAVQQGAVGYPYHLDGELCAVYPAADILIMGNAATAHKLYHTTYCNHLNAWVRRCETAEEVEAIPYGAALPEDLAANMAAVLGAMEGGYAS